MPGIRAVAACAVLLITLLFAPLMTAPAEAAPLPADYSGGTHGDVLDLDVTAAGIFPVTAVLAHSATVTDSQADPRAHAESANVEVGALGIPVGVSTDAADANNAAPTDSYDTGLGEVDVPGLLDTGIITGTGSATWAGDAACVPDGQPIAESTTELAGATLFVPAIEILNLGTVTTTGSTTLDAGSVVSSSTGNLASLSLINGLVDVQVLSQPTLTATSDGTTGVVTPSPYAVSVTIGGTSTTLTAGMSIPIVLTVGLAEVDLVLSVGQLTDSSSGATGSGSMTFLTVTGTITALATELASLDIGILPLSATAAAPTGGVECTVLTPPVITTPTDGATTSETPTIAGTGIPGATVTVTEGGTTVGTALVAADGSWTLVPPTPLSVGDHTIIATQALADAASGPSNEVTFTVEDLTAPAAPVITAPADGSTTNDSTPSVTGRAEPGSTVTVTDGDGLVLGSAVADANGDWAFDSVALADGTYTITATATDAAGNVSPADSVRFTVDTSVEPPLVTEPADGGTITDRTPTISGTGEPGATVEVTIDGQVVGTAVIGDDGTWSLAVDDALACGAHTLRATQRARQVTSAPSEPIDFTVECEPAGEGGLPDTGAPESLVALALLGVGLFGAGMGLVRRRTRTDSSAAGLHPHEAS